MSSAAVAEVGCSCGVTGLCCGVKYPETEALVSSYYVAVLCDACVHFHGCSNSCWLHGEQPAQPHRLLWIAMAKHSITHHLFLGPLTLHAMSWYGAFCSAPRAATDNVMLELHRKRSEYACMWKTITAHDCGVCSSG